MAGRSRLSPVCDMGSYSSSCGYCGGSDGSCAHGMQCPSLTVYAYQDLIDQGWRRSGKFLYKPDMSTTCCKPYTIRLDVTQFQPDRAQARLLRKWRSFLAGADGQLAEGGDPGSAAQSGAAQDCRGTACTCPTERPAAGGEDTAAAAPLDNGDLQQDVRPSMMATEAAAGRVAGAALAAAEQPGLAQGADEGSGPRAGQCQGEAGKEGQGQPKGQGQGGEEEGCRALLERLMQGALAEGVATGELPSAAYPPVTVRPCTAKQRHALPPEVRYTCASAFPLAAAAAAAAARAAAARAAATAASDTTGSGAGAVQASGAAPAAGSASQPSGRLPKKLRKQQGQGQGQGQGAGTVSAPAVAQVLASRFNSALREAVVAGAGGAEGAEMGGLVGAGFAGVAAAADAADTNGPGEGAAQPLLSLLAATRLGRGVEARAVPSGHINFHVTGSDGGACSSQGATATGEAVAAAAAAAAGRASQGHARMSGCGVKAAAKEQGDRAEAGTAAGTGVGPDAGCGAPGGRPCKRRQLGCGASSQDGTKGHFPGMGNLDGNGGTADSAIGVQASPSALSGDAGGRSGSGTGPGLGPSAVRRVGQGSGDGGRCPAAQPSSAVASVWGLGPDQLWVQREGEDEEEEVVGAPGRQQQQRRRLDGHAGTREGGREGDGCCGGDGSAGGVGRRQRRRLEVRLVPSAFIEEEFELYKRYQMSQHGDDPDDLHRASYCRFLVESPLTHVSREQDPAAPACGYGSFHQQYWLDGKLVAVGVVDVLPRCLSSVYLFWDTDCAHLALGKFTALQEIRWVQEHLRSCPPPPVPAPSLRYYYMGFYIHTCPKMRYKAEYRPSDLLCPVNKVWVRINPPVLAALDQQPLVTLSTLPGATTLPNQAQPNPHRGMLGAPGDAAAAAATQGAGAGQGSGSGEGGGAGGGSGGGPAVGGEEDEGGDGDQVCDTLVLVPGTNKAMPLELLRQLYNVDHVMPELPEAVRRWRRAVGWTAPQLVYVLQ